jgi:acetyl/propionyl-CoA carboxylase alpha subunit
VNTRLQVEHPVTETVTGIDLVRQQILIADGHRLSLTQDDVKTKGHAIECRICAEDPQDHFFPSTGTLTSYTPPQGPKVRVDNGLAEGDSVSIYYDPLMAKVISWGQDRFEAIESMKRALAEFNIQGVKSTIPFCLFVLNNSSFQNGEFDTKFVETNFGPETLNTFSPRQEIAAVVAAVLLQSGAQHQQAASRDHLRKEQTPWKRNRLGSYR